MDLVLRYLICFVLSVLGHVAYVKFYLEQQPSVVKTLLTMYALTFVTKSYKKDGALSEWIQRLGIWNKLLSAVLDSFGVESEEKLDDSKQYIFGSFPHGATTTQHMLTMTNSCGFFEKVYAGPKRDLAATVLFFTPFLRELLLALGNVDAGGQTARYNLKKGRSLQIFVGGEKEQLMTKPGEHKIYLKSRKGFIKLAIEFGCDLVPTYAFGENELYHISEFGLEFRKWIQEKFSVAFCITIGSPRWWNWIAPKRGSKLHLVVGKPIKVERKARADITEKDINSLHAKFCEEITRLFEAKKMKYGVAGGVKLHII